MENENAISLQSIFHLIKSHEDIKTVVVHAQRRESPCVVTNLGYWKLFIQPAAFHMSTRLQGPFHDRHVANKADK